MSRDFQDQIESFIEEIKNNNLDINIKEFEKIAKTVAYSTCIKKNQLLNEQEMLQIVRSLFKCESPFIGLDGDPCVILFEPEKIFKL